MSDWATIVNHPRDEQAATMNRQPGISVGHEGPPEQREDFRHLHSAGRSLPTPRRGRHQRPCRVHLGLEVLATDAAGDRPRGVLLPWSWHAAGYRLEQRLPRQCRAWLAEDPDRDQWHHCLTFAPTLEACSDVGTAVKVRAPA
jgi:hypothetical protein